MSHSTDNSGRGMSFGEALQIVSKLETPQLDALKSALASPEDITTSPEFRGSLSDELQLPVVELVYLVQALRIVEARLNVNSSGLPTRDEFGTFLVNLIKGYGETDASAIEDRSVDAIFYLLINNDGLLKLRKKETVRQGFIDEAIEFNSIVDVRPVFDSERSTLVEYVIAAQLQIGLRSHNPIASPILVQIDKNGLQSLKLCIEQIEKKIALISSDLDGRVSQ